MPGPYLDIYALTAHRDAATLDAFIEAFVDRAATQRLSGFELMMEPIGATEPPDGFDRWDWVPVASLSEIVAWGLSFPRRTFTTYLPSYRSTVKTAVLSFTADNQLIVGIAVYDDERGNLVTEDAAKVLLDDLMRLVGAHRGLMLAEGPPPRTEAEFETAGREPGFVHSTGIPPKSPSPGLQASSLSEAGADQARLAPEMTGGEAPAWSRSHSVRQHRFRNSTCLRYCQMSSSGFSSGAYAGNRALGDAERPVQVIQAGD